MINRDINAFGKIDDVGDIDYPVDFRKYCSQRINIETGRT